MAAQGLAVARDYWAFRLRHSFLARGAEQADPSKKVAIVSLGDWIYQTKFFGILAKALQLRGYTPVIITQTGCRTSLRYYRAFGFDQFVFFDALMREVPEAAVAGDVESLLGAAADIRAVKASRYRDVSIGRQVLSTIARSLHQGGLRISDPAMIPLLRGQLTEAMRSVLAAEAFMDSGKPEIILLFEKDYVGYGSLYDVALNRGVHAIQWCGSHRDDARILKRYTPETRNVHPVSLSEETWAALRAARWTAQHEEELAQEFRERYEVGRWSSPYNRQAGRLYDAAAVRERLGLDPAKKTGIVFAHLLWDATFFYGEDLFEDYAEWLVETVRAACANPSINWVVKLHPANVWKLQLAGVSGELNELAILRERIGSLPGHVKVLPPDTDINPFSMFGVTDYCLTVRGTIGIEMAAFGVPVFTAGTGRYAGLGFTIDSSTREEYLKKLARIRDFDRLRPEQRELAAKYAYGMFRLRPWRHWTFEAEYRLRGGGHPLDHNVKLHARSLDEIARGQDLRAFADWVTTSETSDFLDQA